MCRQAFSKYLFTILLFTVQSVAAQKLDSNPFPSNVKRVLFLGNSITYAGDYVTYVEAYLNAKYPTLQVEFINVGLPSETVSGLSEPGHADGKFPRPDLHQRLDRVLKQTKPDWVFACYGMNDGIYMPLNEDRFTKFKEGINWLHAQLEKSNVRKIIHLTPPVIDERKGHYQGYAHVLDVYSDWLMTLREKENWEVIDIHYPMKSYLQHRLQKDPSFALANDGVHPGQLGHWLMAKEILIYLGEDNLSKAENIHEALIGFADSEKILELISQRQSIMKDAWLTSTGHKRPEMKTGLPLREAKKKAKEITKEIDSLRK